MRTPGAQVVTLAGAVTVLSLFMKNIGALAIFMPVAIQVARRSGTPVSALLMPMAFGSLLGGLVTLVGTSPNIIVSRVRAEVDRRALPHVRLHAGRPRDRGGRRRLPRASAGGFCRAAGRRRRSATAALARGLHRPRRALPEDSPVVGRRRRRDSRRMAEGEVTVTAIVRGRDAERLAPVPDGRSRRTTSCCCDGEPEALERLVGEAGLSFQASRPRRRSADLPDEASASSRRWSRRTRRWSADARAGPAARAHGVNLLAVAAAASRITPAPARSSGCRAGDVVVLQGAAARDAGAPARLGLLPLAEREIVLGRRAPRTGSPVAILGVAVAARRRSASCPWRSRSSALRRGLSCSARLTLREAYEAIEWPILVLLGGAHPGQRRRADDGRHRPHRRAGLAALAARSCRRSARSPSSWSRRWR